MTKPPTDDQAQRIAHEFAGDDPDCGDGQHGAFCSGLAARIREYGTDQYAAGIKTGEAMRMGLDATIAQLRAALEKARTMPMWGFVQGGQ